MDRGSPMWGEGLYDCRVQAKMLSPGTESRIVKPDRFPGQFVNCRYVAAFISIAKDTSVGQIFDSRCPAMFAADDMVDLVRKGGIVFVNEAVLAAVICALRYLCSEKATNVTRHEEAIAWPWLLPFS